MSNNNSSSGQQNSVSSFGNFTYTTYLPGSYGAAISGGSAGGNVVSGPSITSPNFTFGISQPISVITLSNNGQEIVRLNTDGTVTWANGIDIDEAAKAFEKALVYSAELKAGITQNVKYSMRDSVFESLINIAKEKGPLSVEDLTYLLEASKIIEKLKGVTGEK